MTATIHTLRSHAPRRTPDDTLRADCERLTGAVADKIRAALTQEKQT